MRKATKILSLLVAFAMLASLFVGCGDGNAADSAVNIGVTDTLSSANPLLLDQSELAKIVCDLQYSQLCELDGELNFVPMLASSITTEDNIHFTVKLDENAKWSDGEAITADDVVFTVLKFASPTIANATMLLYAFEGTDDETGFTAAGATPDDLPGCKAVDEHTVEFTAKYEMPLTSFQNTYGRYLHILPKHMLEGMSDSELLTTAYFDTAE
ncbi:MAG: ABC transporter substrate-binding protein, partial [Clostridia bacterium]|nr:ABC transporter substrate-binding protein [Clostridia bacterium]